MNVVAMFMCFSNKIFINKLDLFQSSSSLIKHTTELHTKYKFSILAIQQLQV